MRLGLLGWLGWMGGLVGCGVAQAASLDQIFVPDTLDAQVSYLETLTGPAWRVEGDRRLYKLGACVLEVTAPGHVVQSLGVELSPQCAPDLSPFTASPNRLPAFPMTVHQAETALGQPVYRADCLEMCGNAYDPSLYAYISGYHANNFIDVLLGIPQVTKPAEDAAAAWAAKMEQAKGADYVTDGTYNCSQDFQGEAAALFRNLRVAHVTVGHNLDPASACPNP